MGQSEQNSKDQAEGLPAEDPVDRDPDDHLNRPDQPDFDEDERRQYEDPSVVPSIADADQPDDR